MTAQTQVRGTVVDEAGDPVIGATIQVQGTSQGTVTNVEGNFNLSAPTGGTLIVSYVGKITQEIPVSTNPRVVLVEDSEMLEEVMVVAYGTAKKESFTGSAAVVKTEQIQARPIANVTKALDGMAPGILASSGSGQPGSGSAIRIRGFGSINSSQAPLYVVDGIPYDGNIASINPNDIESMTILKDASAGALYGSRGANGVIMITTKKGKEGKMQTTFKANWGISSRSIPRYETMGEAGYLETIFQSYKNNQIINNGLSPQAAALTALVDMKQGVSKIFGENEQYNPFNYTITELIDPVTGKVRSDATLRYSENWMDEAIAKNPLRQEYVTTFSGGTQNSQYMFSLGYLDEQGLLKTTNFQRYTGRMSLDSQLSRILKSGLSLAYSRRQSNSAVDGGSANSNVWYSAQLMAPIFPVFEKDGDGKTVLDNEGKPQFDYGKNRPAGANADWNTIATLYDDKYDSGSDNLSGRTYFTFSNFKGIAEGLSFTINYGFDLINSTGLTYYNPYNGNAVGTKGRVSRTNGRTFSHTLNQLINYNKDFDKHHFDFLVGHEFYKLKYNYLGAAKTGFPFGGLYELDAATTVTSASSYEDNYAIESVLSRFNYDFEDKYYLSASFRTDGSSRFYKDYRWGQFWSVGANWRVSQEEFLRNVDWINNMSVKTSYGVQGNDGLSSYYAWQAFYDLGYPNDSQSGAAVTSLENKELRWEKNGNLNVGLEGRFFDRINLSVEWYNRKTTDMLMSFPMASSLGFDGYNKNVGSMKNTGVEASIDVDMVRNRDFLWNIMLTGSTVKNKVLTLADKPEIISGSYIIKVGETLNSFYAPTSAGVDPATGEQLFWVWDTDEDGNKGEKYISNDAAKATASKEILGSRIPDLYGSITNSLRYKNFDLNFMFTYSIGGKVLDGVYRTLLYGNYVGNARSSHLDRAWKQPGDITDIPKIEIGKSYIVTDNSLIDASYFTVKNITLGYTLPKNWTKNIGSESMRLTLTGDNLYILTHLKGMDPQYNFTGGTGFGYVPTRTIMFGVDLKF